MEVDIDADMLNALSDFMWCCLAAFGLADAASRRAVSAAAAAASLAPASAETAKCKRCVAAPAAITTAAARTITDYLDGKSDTSKSSSSSSKGHTGHQFGARLTFEQEEFRYLRGTVNSFLSCLQERYTYDLLSSLFASLGQSSLLNLPRMPYEFGRNTIGLAANAVDSVSAGLGSLLSTFTFDSEYISKRQTERGRTASGMREGILSAGKNIGEGVWALSSIVTNPIEGAQKEGLGGFFKGLGKGLVGSLIKPLDRVGQAVSDVTRGIHAEVSRPMGALKLIRNRKRRPRMLGELGEVRPFDEVEAQLRASLGLSLVRRLHRCIAVSRQHLAVLFYPQDIFFVDLQGSNRSSSSSRSTGSGDRERGGSTSPPTSLRVLWHFSVLLIREVLLSSHGVTVRTAAAATPQQRPEEALARASSLSLDPNRSSSSSSGSSFYQGGRMLSRVGQGSRHTRETLSSPPPDAAAAAAAVATPAAKAAAVFTPTAATTAAAAGVATVVTAAAAVAVAAAAAVDAAAAAAAAVAVRHQQQQLEGSSFAEYSRLRPLSLRGWRVLQQQLLQLVGVAAAAAAAAGGSQQPRRQQQQQTSGLCC
ncbi:hypothetical protein ACSSS7_002437 [Eimeria intestinalis]